jgi:hypothetical protein
MKMIGMISIKCSIILVLYLSIFLVKGISCAEEANYPIKVEIIDKNQAIYDTPENTLAALCSALIKEDLDWTDETLTEESLKEQKRLFEKAGIDPRKIFELEKGVTDTYIIDRMEYKDAVVLVIEDHDKEGSITKIPLTFVREGGKWKQTNKFASDENLWDYIDYIKPEEIISSTTKIRPNRWNLNWYNRIKEHMEERKWIKRFAERVCVLCIIGNLKDNKGNPHSVEEIVPETLLLNYLVHPQPWWFGQGGEIALIFDLREGRDLNEIRGFKDWHNGSKFSKKYKGPVMLVRFNKFKAMETLSEMIPGEDYDIIVSGELKDGKRFKGSAKITITGWEADHRWDLKDPDWLNSDRDTDNWWNKEKAFEDWWEKTGENHKH